MFTLLGIRLGSPAGELRAQLGDPLLVEKSTNVSRIADFLQPTDPSAVLRVTERDGVVFAIEIERERAEPLLGASDAYGVALGMSRLTVQSKRGQAAFDTMNTLLYPENANQDASLIYRFDGDTLESIKLVGSGATAAGNSALPPIAEAAGDDYVTAVLDRSASVLISDHFRERYLTVHGCDANKRTSTAERRLGRTYIVVTANCNAHRRWFFDTTRAHQ